MMKTGKNCLEMRNLTSFHSTILPRSFTQTLDPIALRNASLVSSLTVKRSFGDNNSSKKKSSEELKKEFTERKKRNEEFMNKILSEKFWMYPIPFFPFNWVGLAGVTVAVYYWMKKLKEARSLEYEEHYNQHLNAPGQPVDPFYRLPPIDRWGYDLPAYVPLQDGETFVRRSADYFLSLLREIKSGDLKKFIELHQRLGSIYDLRASGISTDLTLIGMAAYHGRHEIIEYMIATGEDPNFRDEVGRAPLHYLATSYLSNPASLKVLLDYGADLFSVDNTGKIPYEHAQESDQYVAMYFLREAMLQALSKEESTAQQKFYTFLLTEPTMVCKKPLTAVHNYIADIKDPDPFKYRQQISDFYDCLGQNYCPLETLALKECFMDKAIESGQSFFTREKAFKGCNDELQRINNCISAVQDEMLGLGGLNVDMEELKELGYPPEFIKSVEKRIEKEAAASNSP